MQDSERNAFWVILALGILLTLVGVVTAFRGDRLPTAAFVTLVGLLMSAGAAWRLQPPPPPPLPPPERITDGMLTRFDDVVNLIDSRDVKNRLRALLAIAVADLDRVDLGSYKSSVGDQQQRGPLY